MSSEAVKLMRLAKKAVSEKKSSEKDFNEIIAGIAKEASLNPEEVNRVVEWTNTIKMLNLYKTSGDKTAEFEVADPKKINGIIHKKASAPVDDFEYIVSKESLMKLATYPGCGMPKKAKPKPKENYKKERAPVVKKAYAKLKDIERKAEQSQMLAYREKDKYIGAMQKIASNLNKHYAESFHDFEQNAMSALGKEAMPYIDVLEKMAYNNPRSLKLKLKNVTKNTENLSLLKEAMVSSKLHHFYRNTAHSFEKLHEDFRSKVEEKLI